MEYDALWLPGYSEWRNKKLESIPSKVGSYAIRSARDAENYPRYRSVVLYGGRPRIDRGRIGRGVVRVVVNKQRNKRRVFRRCYSL